MYRKIILLQILILFLALNHVKANKIKNSNDTILALKINKPKIILSGGLGFPSIIAYALTTNKMFNTETIKSTQPLILKAEAKWKKIGIGINYTSNVQEFKLIYTPMSASIIKLELYDISLRSNFYFVDKTLKSKHQNGLQIYTGGAVGFIHAKQTTTYGGNTTYASMFKAMPISFEATFGARYFPIKNIGIFTELGLGKLPIQLRDKFIGDSFVQGGISIKF